ncbi:MAG TPA: hypothetical protein VNZ03_25890 [Terriglobales bacterium]|jgi:hypothetical protein|nr:hypothetical protein [Terriglobales bacterium]
MKPKTARTQGTVVNLPVEVGSLVAEANQLQQQRQERIALAAEKRQAAYDNAPNTVCYADTAFKDWKPGDKVPPCNVCHGLLHPGEHHNCPGFRPRYRTDGTTHEERAEMRKAGWDDFDDDQYDETTPDETTHNLRMQHEAETGNTYDQVVIEGMTEEEYLMKKFGYIPSFEDFEE